MYDAGMGDMMGGCSLLGQREHRAAGSSVLLNCAWHFPGTLGSWGTVERDRLGGDRALQQECPLPQEATWLLGAGREKDQPKEGGGRRDLPYTGRVTDGFVVLLRWPKHQPELEITQFSLSFCSPTSSHQKKSRVRDPKGC